MSISMLDGSLAGCLVCVCAARYLLEGVLLTQQWPWLRPRLPVFFCGWWLLILSAAGHIVKCIFSVTCMQTPDEDMPDNRA